MANPFIDALSRGGSTANQGMSVANSIAGSAIRLFSVDNAGFRVLRLLERREQEKKMQELQELKTISDIYAQAQVQKLNEAKLAEQQREFDEAQKYKYNELDFRKQQLGEQEREFNENLKYKYRDLGLREQQYKTNRDLNFAQLALRKKQIAQQQEQQNLAKAKLAKQIADKLESVRVSRANTNLGNTLKALQIMPNKVGDLDNVAKQQLTEQVTTALLNAQNIGQQSEQKITEQEKTKYKLYSSVLKNIGMKEQANYIDTMLKNAEKVKQPQTNNKATKQTKYSNAKEVEYVANWTGLPNTTQQNLAINTALANNTRLRKAIRSDRAIDTLYRGIENMYKRAKENRIDPRQNRYFTNFFKEIYKTKGKDKAVEYIDRLPASVTEKELLKKTAERSAVKEIAQKIKATEDIKEIKKRYGDLGVKIKRELDKITPETTEKIIKAVKGQNIIGDIIRKTTPFLGKSRKELAPKVANLIKKKELYYLKKYGVAPVAETYDIVATEEGGDKTPMQNAIFVDNPSVLLKEKETRVLDKNGEVKETSLLEAIFGESKFKGRNRLLDFKEYLDENKLTKKEKEIVELNIAKMANILREYKNTHTSFDEDDKVTTTLLNKNGEPIRAEIPIRQILALMIANLSNEVNKVK